MHACVRPGLEGHTYTRNACGQEWKDTHTAPRAHMPVLIRGSSSRSGRSSGAEGGGGGGGALTFGRIARLLCLRAKSGVPGLWVVAAAAVQQARLGGTGRAERVGVCALGCVCECVCSRVCVL